MKGTQGGLFEDTAAREYFGVGCRPVWGRRGTWKFLPWCNSFCKNYSKIIVKGISRVLMKSATEPFDKYVIDMPTCRYAGAIDCRPIRERLRVLNIMLKMMKREQSRLEVGARDVKPGGMSGCEVGFLWPSSRMVYRCAAWQACRSLVGDPNDKAGGHSNVTTTLACVRTNTYKCVHLVGESKLHCGNPLERWTALNKGIAAALKKKTVLERRLTA